MLQSAPAIRPNWLSRCLQSVDEWTRHQGITRRLIGDELFDLVSPDWRRMAGPEKLPLTDYARLLWMRHLHQEGHERVIWLDADILMLNMMIELPAVDFVCREFWFAPTEEGEPAHLAAINNCAMSFQQGSSLLSWYLEQCEEAPKGGPLKKLELGPYLLSGAHDASSMPCLLSIPTLSPYLIEAVLQENFEVLGYFRRTVPWPIDGVHLCSSVSDTTHMDAAVDKLQGGLLARVDAFLEEPA